MNKIEKNENFLIITTDDIDRGYLITKIQYENGYEIVDDNCVHLELNGSIIAIVPTVYGFLNSESLINYLFN